MHLTPRPYQTDLVDRARLKIREVAARLAARGIKRKPRIMVQLGCGGGKTFIASLIARGVIDKSGTVAFLCHRDFLLDQTSATFKDVRIDHSFIAAGKWLNPWSNAHIGMIGSMKSRMNRVRAPTLCFMDEAHHSVAKTWSAVIEAWPDTIFIMLSATPGARSDGRGLEEVCDDIICGPSNKQLIEMGALSDYRYFAPTSPDLTGVHVRAGDYNVEELDAEMSRAVVIGDIVQHYKKIALGTKAIYFATTIETSKKYAAAFNAAGIKAAHVDADTGRDERKAVAKAIATGRLDVMCNVMIATEGYDLAAQAEMPVTIETVGLCRPTKSLPLLIQMEMRAMRAKPTPGTIIDHAGCLNEHNFLPDDEIEWTLKGGEKREAGKIFQCDGCGAAMPRNTAVCKHCGFVNGEDMLGARKGGARVEVEHKDGDLQEVDKATRAREKKLEEWTCESFEDLLKLGKKRGYSNPEGWSAHIWTLREKARKEKDFKARQQISFFEEMGR